MAIGSVDQLALVTGQIAFGVTSIAVGQSFPGGGTAMGLIKDAVVRPAHAYSTLHAEEFGVESIETLDLGAAYVLTCTLRTFDDDALGLIFPGVTTGTSSGHKVISWPPAAGTNYRAGSLISQRSRQIVFWPDDSDRHPMTILYNAIPMVAETVELNLNLAQPIEAAMVFLAIRDNQGRVIAQGRKEDLSL